MGYGSAAASIGWTATPTGCMRSSITRPVRTADALLLLPGDERASHGRQTIGTARGRPADNRAGGRWDSCRALPCQARPDEMFGLRLQAALSQRRLVASNTQSLIRLR